MKTKTFPKKFDVIYRGFVIGTVKARTPAGCFAAANKQFSGLTPDTVTFKEVGPPILF